MMNSFHWLGKALRGYVTIVDQFSRLAFRMCIGHIPHCPPRTDEHHGAELNCFLLIAILSESICPIAAQAPAPSMPAIRQKIISQRKATHRSDQSCDTTVITYDGPVTGLGVTHLPPTSSDRLFVYLACIFHGSARLTYVFHSWRPINSANPNCTS